MYQCGDGVLDAGSKRLKEVYRRSVRFNAEYSAHFEKKVQDWLTAFFFAFGGCSMSKDFNTFVEYLERMYLHPKYDKHCSDHGSEPFELNLVRRTIQTLAALCQQCDDREADEQCYIPVKFFMLTCMAREISLEKEILKQTVDDNQGKATVFFPYLKKMITHICTGDFKEFNSKYMVTQFISYCMMQYCGLNLEGEAFKITIDRTSGIVNVPLPTKPMDCPPPPSTPRTPFGVPATPRSAFTSGSNNQADSILASSPVSTTRKRKIQDILGPPASPDMVSTTNENDVVSQSYPVPNLQQQQQQQFTNTVEEIHQNKRKKGYATLPEMYELGQTSAQMEALSKRTASISYYATVSLIISYYVDHVHGVGLPRGLKYSGPTRIKDLSK